MRWYLVMIPFFALFLYSGFKWEVYQSQIDDIDQLGSNSLYSSVNISRLRNYDTNVLTKEFKLQLVKFMSLEMNYPLDYKIGYKIVNKTPLAIALKLETNNNGIKSAIQKIYILDSSS